MKRETVISLLLVAAAWVVLGVGYSWQHRQKPVLTIEDRIGEMPHRPAAEECQDLCAQDPHGTHYSFEGFRCLCHDGQSTKSLGWEESQGSLMFYSYDKKMDGQGTARDEILRITPNEEVYYRGTSLGTGKELLGAFAAGMQECHERFREALRGDEK